jgi:hypothetical protein
MRKQIQEALSVLIGQPLWSSGRAADLDWFQFGPRKTVQDSRGHQKLANTFSTFSARGA